MKTKPSFRFLSSSLAAATLALLARPALAQDTTETRQVDLPKFQPAPPGDRFFGVPSPFAAGPLTWKR